MRWPKSIVRLLRSDDSKSSSKGTCRYERSNAAVQLAPQPDIHKHKAGRRVSTTFSEDKRRSIEIWSDARRQRSSLDTARLSTSAQTTDHLEVERSHGATIINKKYAVLRTLGQGQYGRVKLCLDLSHCMLVAIKICSKTLIRNAMSSRSQLRRSSSTKRRSSMQHSLRPARSFEYNAIIRPARASTSQLCDVAYSSIAESCPNIQQRSMVHSEGGEGWLGGAGNAGLAPANAFLSASSQLNVLESLQEQRGRVRGRLCSSHARSLPGVLQSQSDIDHVSREIAILKKLDHPNVVRLLEAVDDPCTDSLLLVMDYVEGGCLEQPRTTDGRWATLPEAQILELVRDILQGLNYLYRNGVIHGDLKPANLLLTADGHVKLADFGSAVIFTDDQADGSVCFGTPAFRAPETLQSGYKLSPEVDMWALGVCMFMWLFGRLPFPGSTPYATYEAVRTQPLQLPSDTPISEPLRDLLHRLLQKDPALRMTAADMTQHFWVTSGGVRPMQRLGHDGDAQAPSASETHNAILRASDREQSMLTVMDEVFSERTLAAGEVLFCANEAIEHIYLIASGELELFFEPGSDGAAQAPEVCVMRAEKMGGGEALCEPPVRRRSGSLDSLLSESDCMHRQSLLDPDDSHFAEPDTGPTLMDIEAAPQSMPRQPSTTPRGNNTPHDGSPFAGSASEPFQRDPATVKPSMQVCHVAVYGAGEALGISALASGAPALQRWVSSARAVGRCVVIEASVSQVKRLSELHGAVGECFAQMLRQQANDTIIVDALERLQVRHISTGSPERSAHHSPKRLTWGAMAEPSRSPSPLSATQRPAEH